MLFIFHNIVHVHDLDLFIQYFVSLEKILSKILVVFWSNPWAKKYISVEDSFQWVKDKAC